MRLYDFISSSILSALGRDNFHSITSTREHIERNINGPEKKSATNTELLRLATVAKHRLEQRAHQPENIELMQTVVRRRRDESPRFNIMGNLLAELNVSHHLAQAYDAITRNMIRMSLWGPFHCKSSSATTRPHRPKPKSIMKFTNGIEMHELGLILDTIHREPRKRVRFMHGDAPSNSRPVETFRLTEREQLELFRTRPDLLPDARVYQLIRKMNVPGK